MQTSTAVAQATQLLAVAQYRGQQCAAQLAAATQGAPAYVLTAGGAVVPAATYGSYYPLRYWAVLPCPGNGYGPHTRATGHSLRMRATLQRMRTRRTNIARARAMGYSSAGVAAGYTPPGNLYRRSAAQRALGV